jgi:hypothetical protein
MKEINIGTKLLFSDGRNATVTKIFSNKKFGVSCSNFIWEYEEILPYLF